MFILHGQCLDHPVRKCRRVDISSAQKRELCQYKKDHVQTTQPVRSEGGGVTISCPTVSEIIKHSAKWLIVSKDSGERPLKYFVRESTATAVDIQRH